MTHQQTSRAVTRRIGHFIKENLWLQQIIIVTVQFFSQAFGDIMSYNSSIRLYSRDSNRLPPKHKPDASAVSVLSVFDIWTDLCFQLSPLNDLREQSSHVVYFVTDYTVVLWDILWLTKIPFGCFKLLKDLCTGIYMDRSNSVLSPINCCVPSPAQSFLVSSPVRTQGRLCLEMGSPLRREEGFVFLSRRHICCIVISHECTRTHTASR
jgi:hypothetical protein